MHVKIAARMKYRADDWYLGKLGISMCLPHEGFGINNRWRCSNAYTNFTCFSLNYLNQESDRKTVSLEFVRRELHVWRLGINQKLYIFKNRGL